MRISHRYRFAFFSNPKTGSSSVRQFLNPYADVQPARNYRERTDENPFYPHITPMEARACFRGLGWDFEGYRKFVFVRNPWARLVSLYLHIRQDRALELPFSEWLTTIAPSGRGGGGEEWERWRRYGAYSIEHFIKDEAEDVLVDQVIRLEDIEHALIPFLEQLGLPGVRQRELPHNNRRTAGDYRAYYTPETAADVAERYRYDITTYGYAFDITA